LHKLLIHSIEATKICFHYLQFRS